MCHFLSPAKIIARHNIISRLGKILVSKLGRLQLCWLEIVFIPSPKAHDRRTCSLGRVINTDRLFRSSHMWARKEGKSGKGLSSLSFTGAKREREDCKEHAYVLAGAQCFFSSFSLGERTEETLGSANNKPGLGPALALCLKPERKIYDPKKEDGVDGCMDGLVLDVRTERERERERENGC